MAIIAPFRGLLYSASRVPDLAQVIAPPGDALSDPALASHRAVPASIVHLDHPEGDAPQRYADAAGTLARWREDGTLEQDDRPSLYLAALRYTSRGMPEKTLRGLFARLRIEDASSPGVRAVEAAAEGLRRERRELTLALRAGISPLVALFSDPGGEVAADLGSPPRRPADLWAADETGLDIQLWRTSDPARMRRLAAGLAARRLWILDGQHLYEAARDVRDRMREEEGGALPAGSRSYDHVLAFLAPMESPGLTLMPYHRVLKAARRFNARSLAGGMASHLFDVKHFSFEGFDNRAEQIRRRLREAAARGRVAIALYAGGADFSLYLLRTEDQASDPLSALPEKLRGMDVAVLETALLPLVRSIAHTEDEPSAVRHTESAERALAWVDAGEGSAALLINPPSREVLTGLADEGLTMPPRSACVLPRVPAGLVMDPLDPVADVHEIPPDRPEPDGAES